jgi:uncharacterized protein YukE
MNRNQQQLSNDVKRMAEALERIVKILNTNEQKINSKD